MQEPWPCRPTKQGCSLDLASLPWRVQSCAGLRYQEGRPRDCIKETSQDLGRAFFSISRISFELTATLGPAIGPRYFKLRVNSEEAIHQDEQYGTDQLFIHLLRSKLDLGQSP